MFYLFNDLFKSKTKEQAKKEAFDKLLNYQDMSSINYYENAFRRDPDVIRSTFNRDLYHEFLKIRRL